MATTNNQIKGNAAEYLVCYELQKRGIPVWQLGGNNKRWDLVFQSGPDEFFPIQVKARTQNTLAFSKEDAARSRGYFFIWYTPSDPRNLKNLKKSVETLAQDESNDCEQMVVSSTSALLVYDSEDIATLCAKGSQRDSNKDGRAIFTNLTIDDIAQGLVGCVKFMRFFSPTN